MIRQKYQMHNRCILQIQPTEKTLKLTNNNVRNTICINHFYPVSLLKGKIKIRNNHRCPWQNKINVFDISPRQNKIIAFDIWYTYTYIAQGKEKVQIYTPVVWILILTRLSDGWGMLYPQNFVLGLQDNIKAS